MRHKIDFLGFSVEIQSLNHQAEASRRILLVLIFIALSFALTFIFQKVPVLILPGLSALIAERLIQLSKNFRMRALNEFDSTHRPYVSKESTESIPIIELERLKREEREK